ncbi:transcriptional regulator [Tistlia consotensis]|uniref:Transcriptional regulator n=1 Tax=Tistlia consotensis USBA 355 TaxID=560819 RepID=A0A1Y6CKN2_9PROT|nr:winged helix-turn-helix domain-containing protein [Tistlia consotensis]SMF73345.1 transcriptional regulator [Tistlia consotensis USBA 355]SNS30617.1 transcriptional regulator [Tistlia consotensis]
MQRKSEISRPSTSFGPFRLYEAERLLEKDGAPLKLGSRALDLLILLVERAGEVVPKNELIARAWPDLTVDESSLRFHIAGLRRALGDGQDGARYVGNVPGRGYCFVAPVAQSDRPQWAPAAGGDAGGLSRSLPRPPTRMFGRDDILRRISGQLAARRFVTVHGPGGIGKTTVAVALGHANLAAFEGAVLFLDLAPLEHASLVSGALGSALGLLVRSDDPAPDIVNLLRDRRMLLIFDSCEHVIEEVAALAEAIYREAPAVSILATSRESLRAEGEQLFELPPLGRPPRSGDLKAEQLLGFPATQLFAECAAAAGGASELTDEDARVVAEICRKLDGIALAIELAASRAGTHGLRETASLLDGRFRLLWRGRRTALPRHQTLKAALDWSYDLIGEPERTVLRRLSLFMGSFTLEAARAVAAGKALDGAEVVEAVEQLVAKSLVSASTDEAGTRYRLLDTTRAYAYAQLAESGEAQEIAERHARHVLDHLVRLHREASDDRPGRRAAGAEQLGNVRAALAWSFSDEGDPALAVSLATAASALFIELSQLNECRRWSAQALELQDESARDHRMAMELNAALGHSLMFTEGNGEEARAALERALALAEQVEDRRSQFRLLSRLHMYHRRTGKISRLLPISRRCQELAGELADPVAVSAAHTLLSVSHHLAGDQAAARAHLEEPLRMAVFRSVRPGHFAFHRSPYISLPRCLWLQGYPDQAIAAARPFSAETTAPDAVTYCIALIWGAAVFQWLGDWATVDGLAARLLAHAERHSLRPYRDVGRGLQGESMIEAGQLDRGVELLSDAIASLRADRYELYTSGFGGSLALGLAAQGHLDRARDAIGKTLASVTADGETFELPELLRIRGEIEARRGDAAAAAESYRASATLAERQGALSWRLRSDTSLARLLSAQGRRGEAREALSTTYARFEEGFGTRDLTAARRLLDALEGSPA